MNTRIWKFPLALVDEQTIAIPQTARDLHLDVQAGVTTLWCLVDTDSPVVDRTILIIGTGIPIPEGLDLWSTYAHLGTVQRGVGVWHVFGAVA